MVARRGMEEGGLGCQGEGETHEAELIRKVRGSHCSQPKETRNDGGGHGIGTVPHRPQGWESQHRDKMNYKEQEGRKEVAGTAEAEAKVAENGDAEEPAAIEGGEPPYHEKSSREGRDHADPGQQIGPTEIIEKKEQTIDRERENEIVRPGSQNAFRHHRDQSHHDRDEKSGREIAADSRSQNNGEGHYENGQRTFPRFPTDICFVLVTAPSFSNKRARRIGIGQDRDRREKESRISSRKSEDDGDRDWKKKFTEGQAWNAMKDPAEAVLEATENGEADDRDEGEKIDGPGFNEKPWKGQAKGSHPEVNELATSFATQGQSVDDQKK